MPNFLSLGVMLLVLLSACQPKPTQMSGDQPQTKSVMAAAPTIPSAWKLISCSADGKTVPAVNDNAFVAIRDGQLGGHTGCNAFGGEWTGKIEKMKVDGVFSTKMYCDVVQDQEQMILKIFRGTVRAVVNDETLVLTNNDITLTLERDDSLLK